MADLGFSGSWTFLWFVCFCLTADQWSKTVDTQGIPTDAVHAVIAFSFFSIGSWGALTYFALARYRQGVSDVTQNYPDPSPDQSTPYPTTYAPPTYPSFQNNSSQDVFQQPPFVPNNDPDGQSSYQPPTYWQEMENRKSMSRNTWCRRSLNRQPIGVLTAKDTCTVLLNVKSDLHLRDWKWRIQCLTTDGSTDQTVQCLCVVFPGWNDSDVFCFQ